MSDYIAKVLVTGANGMLGKDLCPMLEDCGYEVIETDIDNLDITNELEAMRVISDVKPEYVIHCAAYTNVDKAEDDIENATLINETGSINIAKACNANDAILIYISTGVTTYAIEILFICQRQQRQLLYDKKRKHSYSN